MRHHLLNTFMNTSEEWHAFVHGAFDGIRSWFADDLSLSEHPDIDAEEQYYKLGFIVGKATVPTGVLVFLFVLTVIARYWRGSDD